MKQKRSEQSDLDNISLSDDDLPGSGPDASSADVILQAEMLLAQGAGVGDTHVPMTRCICH